MKDSCILLAAQLFLASAAISAPVALSQQSSSQPSSALLSAEDVPFILVELSSSLNVKKLKPGDAIKAQVVQDVLSHGKIIIPAESKLLGHITEANVRSEQIESRLGLVFDKVLLKRHEEVSLRGVVQAVSPPVTKAIRTEEEEDQFLPPPAMSGRGPSITPIGSGRANRTPTSTSTGNRVGGPTLPVAGIPDGMVLAPLPGSRGDRSANGGPNSSAQNQALSLGTRMGVFGLKGLSLSTEIGSLTPGPVIVSRVADVRLEYGTQMLLKILGSASRPPSP
jgi:hypothetical protein